MACLINSITELPKVLPEDPFPTADQETFEKFGRNMVCVANGEELEFFNADSYEGDLAYVSSDNNSDRVVIFSALSSGNFILNAQGYGKFSTIESLTFCSKEVKPDSCVTPVCDEGKEPIVITPTTTKLGNEYAGTSDKSKPTSVPQYSIYLELDTGKFYYYDNGEWNEMPCSGGGGGCKTATLNVICTNPDVSEISIYYGVDVGGFDYMLNGEAPLLIEGGAVDLFVGDKNSASFIGIYNDSEVDLNLESVTGDGEIKEDDDDFKWLEVHGDCTVTLSYTP